MFRLSLRLRLLAIALVAVAPIAILAFFNLYAAAQERHHALARAATETVRALTTAVDTEISASIAALEILATSRSLAQGDRGEFYQEARGALEQRSAWENIVLIDPSGQQLLNLRRPFGAALPSVADKASLAAVLQLGKPVLTDLVAAPLLGKPRFAVRVPVFRDGRVESVLSAAIRQERMRELLVRQKLPSDAVISIVDRNGVIVARSRGHEEWYGRPSSQTLRDFMAEHSERYGITTTLEGDEVYTVFSRSPVTGWAVAMGIPRATVDGPLLSGYVWLIGVVLLSILTGLGGAYVVASTVTRPMDALRTFARSIRKGEAADPPSSAISEVQDAMQALVAAQAERETLLSNEQEARRSAEAASRGKDEFLAMLGHELRNPLAAIASASSLLEHGADTLPDSARLASQVIRRQSLHLARILDDLLDVSRVIAGKITLKCDTVDLRELVERIVRLHQSTQDKRHTFVCTLAPVWVYADPSRVEQIISNLISNAQKYTPSAGTITVELAREADCACLRVRDTGVGIDPALLPRIFDLFVQGARTLDRADGGLGIGLTLVRRLAELHGGEISAASEGAGRGSEFVLRLPAVVPPAARAENAAAAATPGRRRILVIEDNADVRETLEGALAVLGHEVVAAADAATGIALARVARPEIAFVDIGLPGEDGYAVARALRSTLGAAIYLVALTGYGLADVEHRAREAGFDLHVVKPIDEDTLVRVLAETPLAA